VSATYSRLVCHRDYRAAARPRVARLDGHVRRGPPGTQAMRARLHRAAELPSPPAGTRSRAARASREPSTRQTMLRRQARSPAAAATFDRGQHISERNIGRQRTCPLGAGWRTKAIVGAVRPARPLGVATRRRCLRLLAVPGPAVRQWVWPFRRAPRYVEGLASPTTPRGSERADARASPAVRDRRQWFGRLARRNERRWPPGHQSWATVFPAEWDRCLLRERSCCGDP
jgi:hypothetical protein